MTKVECFKDLIVWQEANQLAEDIATKLVRDFPKEERYRLSDQIIRSSRSVSARKSQSRRKATNPASLGLDDRAKGAD